MNLTHELESKNLEAMTKTYDLDTATLKFEQEKFNIERRPEMFLTIEPSGLGINVSPKITNVGRTPAKDITIEINGIPGNSLKKDEGPDVMDKSFGIWTIPTMLPGEARVLNMVNLNTSNMAGLYAIEMKATIHDMYKVPWTQSPQSIPIASIMDVLMRTSLPRK
jgi:uncharacterized membrane protein